MSDIVVGIDLGTTFSAIAWVDDTGRVEVIPNREGENITPSVVLVDNGKFVVGRSALNQAIARPNDVAQWIKRQMGESYLFQDRWTPEEISAEILRKLVTDAQDHLQKPIKRAVVTVPAYFNATQRSMTQKAGDLAGIHVEDPLDEPEAAAIHFGVSNLKDGERVLVCDLGGGTYDATILLYEGGVLKAEKTRGSKILGGHDWTSDLVELCAARIQEQLGASPREDLFLWQRLYDECEKAKCRLSSQTETQIPWSQNNQTIELKITRPELEAQCACRIQEAQTITLQAISDAKLTIEKINHVLIVGGSSRLPSFETAIAQLTGKTPLKPRNPDEAVARGAAMVANGYARGKQNAASGRITLVTGRGASQSRIVIQRRNPHALGTRVIDPTLSPPAIVSDAIIPENSDLPATGEKEYALSAGQTEFQVPVIELDSHGNIQDQWANYRFFGAPRRSNNAPIRVRFEVTGIKVPNVTAIDVLSGKSLESEKTEYREPEIREMPANAGPATVVLAVDCSGSMSGSKIFEARQAVLETGSKFAGMGWAVGVVSFGGPASIYPAATLVSPTTSAQAFEGVIEQLQAGGGTPMEAGMECIRNILENTAGKRVAIIITDGEPNSKEMTRQTVQTLKALRIILGTIPIGAGADHAFLSEIGDLASNIPVDNQGKGLGAAVMDILARV